MTFLEFVIRHYIGKPTSGRYWPCPWCEHPTPSLVVNDVKGEHRIKFRCHRCHKWGDEFDVIWRFNPDTKHGDRVAIADELRPDWVSQETDQSEPQDAYLSSPWGDKVEWSASRDWVNFRNWAERIGVDADEILRSIARALKVDGAVSEVSSKVYSSQEFRTLVRVLKIDAYYHPFPDSRIFAILDYQAAMDKHVADSDALHLASCDDENCQAAVCRIAAGLPPLSRAEVAEKVQQDKQLKEEGRQRKEDGRRQRLERIRRKVRLFYRSTPRRP